MTTQTNFQSQSLNDWLFYLESQHHKEIDLGLERVIQVAKKAEIIELNAGKVVLVAGTNGKGTTIRFMEQYLVGQGFNVGVYSSPHLFTYNERVRINGKNLPDQYHIDAFAHIEASRAGSNLTYFEFGTLAAYKIFSDLKLDYVLVEVGLGGRLDATNILNQDLAVLTSLGLDHTDWLGDTIEQIGFEKAGIFKPNQPAVVGFSDAPETVFQQATNLQVSKLSIAGRDYQIELASNTWHYKNKQVALDNLPKPLIPIQNVATAITSLIELGVDLDVHSIDTTIKNMALAGRMQEISGSPKTMVDVAHNPQSVAYLNTQLKQHPNFEHVDTVVAVVAMMKDKDIEETLKHIKDSVDVWLVGDLVGNPRAETATNIQQLLRKLGEDNIEIFDTVSLAWQRGKDLINEQSLLLGFGSFYTVADILETEHLTEEI